MAGFNVKKFRNPSGDSHPGYFWVTSSEMTESLMMEQLHDMCNRGAKSVCLHPSPKNWSKVSRMEPDYLSKEYLQLIGKIVDECKKLGMNYYFYDEGGYPSGSAAGEVYASDPERFAPTHLVKNPETGKIEIVREFAQNLGYPNLLEKGATEKFVEITHEKLKTVLGKHFGKTIKYTFTDEPCIPTRLFEEKIAWCSDFAEEFFSRKKYRIEPFLADLFRKPAVNEPAPVRRHRLDYMDVRSQLFVERFLYVLRDWARKNKLLSGGHFGGEDEPFGNYYYGYCNIIRSLRALDFPGVDVIWRQLYPVSSPRLPDRKLVPRPFCPVSSGAKSKPFTKYASSVANQAGRKAVLSETFAVYGSGLKPEVMRWLIDYQLMRGANRFVFSNIQLRVERQIMSGCRPHFGTADTLWDWFDIMHRYTARMSELLTMGTPQISTLMYHDIRGLWCGGKIMKRAEKQHLKTAEAILQRQCDFDFADDDAIINGKIKDGKIIIGPMSYDTLVIDSTEFMTKKALAQLEKFKLSGGKVISGNELDSLVPTLKLKKRTSCLRASKRICGGETLYFVTNESPYTHNNELLIPEKGNWQIFDAETGKRYSVDNTAGTLKWKFTPYSSLVLVINSAVPADEELPTFRPSKKVLSLSDWQLKAVKKVIACKDHFEVTFPDEAAIPAAPGDWRKYLGDTFSGEAVYYMKFDAPKANRDALLDLGRVKYVCTVKINGKELGRKFWGPYQFVIPADMLQKSGNILEIKVCNTMANLLTDKELNDYWKETIVPPSPYEVMQKGFEAESLESGLLDPVKITFSAR